MSLVIKGTYENGVLKPDQPLPLKDHERVQITVTPSTNWVRATYDICGWKGSAEDADRFAMDAELEFPPPSEEP